MKLPVAHRQLSTAAQQVLAERLKAAEQVSKKD